MGDLAVHIAKIARRRHPDSAVPDSVRPIIEAMSQGAAQLAYGVAEGLKTRDPRCGRTIEAQDDAVDELHRRLYVAILEPGRGWTNDVAIDLTLIGRYYERFADHAVSVAHRLTFAITGEALSLDPPMRFLGEPSVSGR